MYQDLMDVKCALRGQHAAKGWLHFPSVLGHTVTGPFWTLRKIGSGQPQEWLGGEVPEKPERATGTQMKLQQSLYSLAVGP